MKQRDNTERIIRPEMKVTVVRSNAEFRTGNVCMNNIDRIKSNPIQSNPIESIAFSISFFFVLHIYVYVMYICGDDDFTPLLGGRIILMVMVDGVVVLVVVAGLAVERE